MIGLPGETGAEINETLAFALRLWDEYRAYPAVQFATPLPGTALAGVVLWLVLVAGLWLIWLGLFRRRRLALAPFLLVQAFALVLVPLFWGSDLVTWRVVGAVLGLLAVGGVVLGLRPSVRAALH
jgi:hypothetical protein